MTPQELEQYGDILAANFQGWEQRALATVARRIKKFGKISPTDAQALKNIYNITGDMAAITEDLRATTLLTTKQLNEFYSQVLSDAADDSKYLYDFKNLPFIPYSKNKELQLLAAAFAKTTGQTMLNLTKTKALYLKDIDGVVRPFKGVYEKILGQATIAISSGLDFNSEMRNVIMQLGGSGVRVNYGSGVTRRLDTVIRQNLLWGAKQVNVEYNNQIGEYLGSDGFEVDYHPSPRPSHAFMGGKMFAYGSGKTVKGTYYPSGDEALTKLADYGCNHFRINVILGISRPTYSDKLLKDLKEKDNTPIKYGDKTKLPYEWKQYQRQLETAVRKQKDIANVAKYSGDDVLRRQAQAKINKYKAMYDDLIKKTGLQATPERMTVAGFRPVKAVAKQNFTEYNKIINIGKQQKHILGTNNYKKGRSFLTVSDKQAQSIINKYGGNGMKIGVNKEKIITDSIIGVNVNPIKGHKTLTDTAIIHYSQNGAHLVPTVNILQKQNITQLKHTAQKIAIEYYDTNSYLKHFTNGIPLSTTEKEQRIDELLAGGYSKTKLIKDIKSMERKILKERGQIK